MFDVNDPLAWLWRAREAGGLARPDARGLRAKGLTSLEGLIKGTGDGREVRQLSIFGLEAGLRPEDRARARALYTTLMAASGVPGTTRHQASLLLQLAASPEAASIPFWAALLSVSPNRGKGKGASKARRSAVAGLLLLAAEGDPEAARLLRTAAVEHPDPDTRGQAIRALARLFRRSNRRIEAPDLEWLRGIALHEPSFSPRYQARRALREASSPAPVDPGAFTLRITKSGAAKWALTTEVPTTLRLAKLTSHILRCMGWDEDHLSIYSLTGDEKDAATQALCDMVKGSSRSANTDDEEAGAIDLCLGALGLVPDHRLELLYDFGDRHRFTITVLSATATPAAGPLPRVIRQEGVCPEQYPE